MLKSIFFFEINFVYFIYEELKIMLPFLIYFLDSVKKKRKFIAVKHFLILI
jgi:hypothetical protein